MYLAYICHQKRIFFLNTNIIVLHSQISIRLECKSPDLHHRPKSHWRFSSHVRFKIARFHHMQCVLSMILLRIFYYSNGFRYDFKESSMFLIMRLGRS